MSHTIILSDSDLAALMSVLQFHVDQDDGDLYPHVEWAKDFHGSLGMHQRRETAGLVGPADSWIDWDAPGHDAEIEKWLLAEGFVDSTWHNDMYPSFTHEGKNLRLWIGEENKEDRESDTSRFCLIGNFGDAVDDFLELADGETWGAIVAHIEQALVA